MYTVQCTVYRGILYTVYTIQCTTVREPDLTEHSIADIFELIVQRIEIIAVPTVKGSRSQRRESICGMRTYAVNMHVNAAGFQTICNHCGFLIKKEKKRVFIS